MYKLRFALLPLATGILFTGCLKDEAIQNNERGLLINEIKGVSFPQAQNSPVVTGVARQTAPQVVDGPFVVLEQSGAAASDVHITLQTDDALVTAASLTPLPAGSFALSPLNLVIAKGERFDSTLRITINNAFNLDPTRSYGIGLRIASVDNGYTIAANAREIVVGITINNPYAADYDVTGYFFHPSSPRALTDVKTLSTVSAAVVRAPHSDLYPDYQFEFSVEDNTNKLINYVARGTTPAGAQSGFMTADVPFAGPFPTPPGTAPWVHATYNNTYDPATRTFWMHYGYAVGASNQSQYTRQAYERWVRQ